VDQALFSPLLDKPQLTDEFGKRKVEE